MDLWSARTGLVLLTVATLLLGGCLGSTGPGDGTATATSISTPTVEEETPTPTAGEETSTPIRTEVGTATATPSPTRTEEGTPTATTTSSEPPSPSPTATGTPPGDRDASPFTDGSHAAALREAGSYTVEFTFRGVSNTSGTSVVSGTEKVDLETGEQYATQTSGSGGQNVSFEYYVPPDSDTAYRHVAGRTEQIPESQASLFNFSDPGTGESADEWPEFREAGGDETTLGPATKYVVDSVEDLPKSTVEEFDSVESVSFTVWVDDDTGVVAKYDYELTYIEDGEENTVRVTFEVTDLGSTTIEKPDWAP